MQAHWSRGDTSSQVPLSWIKIKKVSFSWLEIWSFMKGMPQMPQMHLRTSSPPTMVWAVLRKLVNLIYICFFFLHFGVPLLWKMVRWTSCRGVQFLPSNKKECKKKSPNKIVTILTWKNLIQYKNSLKYMVGWFWRFSYVYTIN